MVTALCAMLFVCGQVIAQTKNKKAQAAPSPKKAQVAPAPKSATLPKYFRTDSALHVLQDGLYAFGDLVRPLIEGPNSAKLQVAVYEWLIPAYMPIWEKQSDTTQAEDMFIVYKTQQYLANFNYQVEEARADSDANFNYHDWKWRVDADAGYYGFWFRRIRYFHNTHQGFSWADARKWTTDLQQRLNEHATKESKSLCNKWIQQYNAGTFVSLARVEWLEDEEKEKGGSK